MEYLQIKLETERWYKIHRCLSPLRSVPCGSIFLDTFHIWLFSFDTLSPWTFCLQYWGLNSNIWLEIFYIFHTTTLYQPVFMFGIFKIGSHELFSRGWLWTAIFQISASQVTKITGVSHWPLLHASLNSCISSQIVFCNMTIMELLLLSFQYCNQVVGAKLKKTQLTECK
jgi:hypothetical protein